MATKCVTWISNCCLPCDGSVPVEVILCVPSVKLVNDTLHTLPAVLTAVTKTCNPNCAEVCTYTFCYDDELVIEPGILGTDITGVICKDCLTTWIEDLISLI